MLLVMLVVEETRRRCLVHLWDVSVVAKEDLLVGMITCRESLVERPTLVRSDS